MGEQRKSDFEAMLHYLRKKKRELKLELGVIGKSRLAALERRETEGKLAVLNEVIENVEDRINARQRDNDQLRQDKVGYCNVRSQSGRQRSHHKACARTH